MMTKFETDHAEKDIVGVDKLFVESKSFSVNS